MGNLSGRQRVDTWVQCPVKNLKAFSCSISLRAGDQSVIKTASIPFIVHIPGTVRCRTRIIYSQALSPVCLPSVYLTSPYITKSPRPSPSLFAYQRLEVGIAWEWGYRLPEIVQTQFLFPPVWFNWIKVFYNSQYYNLPVILLKAKTKTTDMGTLCLVDPTQTTVSQLFIV